MIYSIETLIRTLYKITDSNIELYFINICTQMIVSCNSLWRFFLFPVKCAMATVDVTEPKNLS